MTHGVVIQRVNPLEHEQEIKSLFANEGEAGAFFAPFFDRSYAAAVASGAWSWIGRDAGGKLVMHIGCFPHSFLTTDGVLKGGLTVNLMVAPEHRSLFPAVALMRRVISDTRALGFDFLYADPNERGRAALKAAGFSITGELARFVVPLAGRHFAEHAAVAAYGLVNLLRWRRARARVRHVSAVDFDLGAWQVPTRPTNVVYPIHPPSVYVRRLAGYPTISDHWFVADGERGAEVAILVRGPASDSLATICAVRGWNPALLGKLTGSIVREMRRLGAMRLQAWTLSESRLAKQLRRVGFLRRKDAIPVLTYAHSERARRTIANIEHWHITQLDCDR